MEESINPALYARVVIERIAVEVTKLGSVPFEDGASERCGNIGFDKDSASEGYEALKTLHKEDDVLVVYVFSYQ